MPIGAIGKYERLDVLGHGASGVVYLAWDTLLRRNVALKEIRAAGPEMERVLEEARVLDRLRHPHIIEIHSVDQVGDAVLIDMELVPGRNLADLLRERAGVPLPVGDAVRIAQAVLDALGYAHERRILHRDVKPANILLGENGVVKLTDFGLAEALGSHSVAGGGGTYPYMAPEDFAENAASDYRSDLWAVGVALYEMLTGRRPFTVARTKDPFSWKRAIEEAAPPPVSALNPALPPALDAVLVRALAKDKTDRFPDARAFTRALQEAVGEVADASNLAHLVRSAPRVYAARDENPVPFVFATGQTVQTLDELLLLAARHWDESRSALSEGRFERFLRAIGEVYIADLAADLASHADLSPDRRLREFLERSRSEEPAEVPGEERTVPFVPRVAQLLTRANPLPRLARPASAPAPPPPKPAGGKRPRLRLRWRFGAIGWWFPLAYLWCLAPPLLVLLARPGVAALQRGSGLLTAWTLTATLMAMLALVGVGSRQPALARAMCLPPIGIGVTAGGAIAALHFTANPSRDTLFQVAAATLLPLGLLLLQAATSRAWRLWLAAVLLLAAAASAPFALLFLSRAHLALP